MKQLWLTLLAVILPAMPGWTQAQDPMKDCPMHQQHQAGKAAEHDHDLMQRGNQGMGFDQDKTTHHFLLSKDGGAIQITANSADDKTSIDQIRNHLAHIARAFQSGDFTIPMFVHDQTPPGVPAMVKLKDQIQYKYEQMENGARVVIRSSNAEAVEAVREFLRFQSTEHKTGDSF